MSTTRHTRYILPAIIALAAAALSWSCTPERSVDPPASTCSRIISVTGRLPEDGSNTRASMDPVDGSLDYLVRFSKGEPIQVFLRQDDRLFRVPNVTVKEVGRDSDLCYFDITIPDGVDLARPMTLFGITTEEYMIAEENGRVLLMCPYYFTPERFFQVPLAFRQEEYLYEEGVPLDLTFSHLYAYVVLHLENTAPDGYAFDFHIYDDSGYELGYLPEYYDENEGTYIHHFIDIETLEPATTIYGRVSASHLFEVPAKGEEKTIYGFYTPLGTRFGILGMKFRTSPSGCSWDPTEYYLEDFLPRYDKEIIRGNAYHLYYRFDGNRFVRKDSRGNVQTASPLLTLSTGNSKLGITTVAHDSFKAFIDLNSDGERQAEETIESGYREYQLQSPGNTNLYGLLQELSLPYGGLTKALFGPGAYISMINLQNNNLDKAALEETYASLPDVAGVRPRNPEYSGFSLLVKGNPGAEEADATIAAGKGWTVDIRITDETKPHILIDYKGWSSEPEEELLLVEKADGYEGDVWVDLNNNGAMDEGEKIERFGLSPAAGYAFTVPGNKDEASFALYGEVKTLIFSGKLNNRNATLHGNTNAALRTLSFGRKGYLALEGLENLERLFVDDLDGIYKDGTQTTYTCDLTAFKDLRILSCRGAEISELLLPVEACPVEYLDLSNTYSLKVSHRNLPALRTLIVSYNYGASKMLLSKLDASPDLEQLEAIGCSLGEEELDALFAALPDRSGKTPGMLRIADNDGNNYADLSIARDKNWKIDTDDTNVGGFEYPRMDVEEW